MVSGTGAVGVQDDVTIPGVKFSLVFLGDLEEIEVVDPENLLGAFAVVDHAGLGRHSRIFVQSRGIELALDDLGNSPVA